VERKLKGHSGWVTPVAFSHEGTRVVSGAFNGSLRILNASTGKLKRKLKGNSEVVRAVAFSHDGTRVVSGAFDGSVRIWDASTGKMERELMGDSVTSVAFTTDGTRVVSGSERDKSLRVWDTSTGESTSLDEFESLQLPDGSKVCHIIPGKFQLLGPGEQVSISQDMKWLLTDEPSETRWIPPEFRNFYVHAFSSSKACLGYHSGLVIIVDLKLDHS
jgi:WD40 repeat protein